MKIRRHLIAIVAVLAAISPPFAPQLLAFPYEARIGADRVWSEQPIDRAVLQPVLSRANQRVATSPLARGDEARHIFLTTGGWRWHWLATTSSGAFALTRPLSEAVVVNRTDLLQDRVFNGGTIAGERSLSGVIAHEKCHGMVRRHFGVWREQRTPLWLREGYCDHVAGESTLSAAQAAQLEARRIYHPALDYVRGRERVDAILAANGGSVDRLFAEAR